MDYILGAGLIFGSVMTIALGRLVLNRPGARVDDETFGGAESIAFVFTVLLTVGVSLIGAKAIDEATLISLVQMLAALAAAAAASVGAWTAIARLAPGAKAARTAASAGSAVPPDAPGRGRPQRPSGAGAQGGRKPQAKRAA